MENAFSSQNGKEDLRVNDGKSIFGSEIGRTFSDRKWKKALSSQKLKESIFESMMGKVFSGQNEEKHFRVKMGKAFWNC